MIVGAIFIPKNLSDLLALIRSQSNYLKSFHVTSGYCHVVLISNSFEVTRLRAFLNEFFCKDHGPITMRTRMVLLSPQDPNLDVDTLLKTPFYQHRITYIKGNPLSFPAMAKAKIELAEACFILLPGNSVLDASQQDAVMVMQALVSTFFLLKKKKFTNLFLGSKKIS
jgi:hypothetical protein